MFRILVSLLLLGLHSPAWAQLRNPSFEQTDSTGSLSNWNVPQGKLTRFSAALFGAIPFTAVDGNYFALLQSDTLHTPIKAGTLEQFYAYADTPKSISLRYLYIPENTSQHARLQLLFTRWNGSSRDTILAVSDTLPVIAQGTAIPIQWNTYSRTLSSFYKSSLLPDSALLSITNDDSQTGKSIRLYLDQISFGKWPVGLAEKHSFRFSLFPNPANTEVCVQTPLLNEAYSIRVQSLSGQECLFFQVSKPSDTFTFNTSELPSGLYILQLISGSAVGQQLITIQH